MLFPLRTSDIKGSPITNEDEDVACERQRIHGGGSKNDILLIRDLFKVKTDWGLRSQQNEYIICVKKTVI